MKCAICKRKTLWDESYGYENFIVCPFCYKGIRKVLPKNKKCLALEIVFTLGELRKEGKAVK